MYTYICIYVYIYICIYIVNLLSPRNSIRGFLSTNPEMQNPVLLALLNPPARPAALSAKRTAHGGSTRWNHVDHDMSM